MKVLHILGELKPSGAETMLLCAATFMLEQGIEGEILATGEKSGVFSSPLENAGYKIHHIPFRKHPQYFLAIYRLVKAGHYDAIHIHAEKASFWVTLILLLAGMPAKRCVRTIHNTFAFTGNLRWRRAWQRQVLSFLGVPHITISKSVQETELNCYNMPTNIIQNWYDSQRFVKTSETAYQQARQQLQLNDNDFAIITVGNCSQVKNHAVLIQAIAGLNKQNIVYLHIGIEKDRSEQELAEQLGIANQIRFLGQQNDILPYLQAADLYVMPSTHEGFSIAATEAIATEVPVLLSNVPGLKDFAEFFNGLYYCEPNAESVRQVLASIMDQPKQTTRLSTKGNAAQAERCFGIKRGASAYISYYKGE